MVARLPSGFCRNGFHLWRSVHLAHYSAQPQGKSQLIGETLVGMTGEVWIALEPFSIGSVRSMESFGKRAVKRCCEPVLWSV